MRRTYRCAECGNTSSVPMRCCGTAMRDEEERAAHIHADISRGICSGNLERMPNKAGGMALYRCSVCGDFELPDLPLQGGIGGRERGTPAH